MWLDNFNNVNFLILCIVIVVGIFGNILSLKIWWSGSRCKRSMFATYFQILALVDLFVLLVPGLNSLLKYVPNYSIQLDTLNELTCKIFTFFTYFSIQLSIWVMVAITTECMLAFSFPIQFHHRKNKERCIFIIFLFLVLGLAILNSSVSLAAEIVINGSNSSHVCTCHVRKLDMLNIITVLTYLSSVGFYVTLPVMIFIICNVTILCKMCQTQCMSSMQRSLTRNMKTTAKLVLLMNTLRTVTAAPLLYNVLTYFEIIKVLNIMDPQVISVISNACLYFSNSVNIFLYLVVKTTFRTDIQSLFRRKILPQSSTIRKQNDGPQDGAINFVKAHRSSLVQLEFQNNENIWV